MKIWHIALLVLVGLMILGSSRNNDRGDLMLISCDRQVVDPIMEAVRSGDDGKLVVALRSRVEAGTCATSRRGVWKGLVDEQALKLGQLFCKGQSCTVFIRTDIFERVAQM